MHHAFHKKGIALTVVVLLISFGIQITVSNRASDVFIDTINFNVLNMPSEVLINKTDDCWVNASSTITISVFGEPGNVSMNASIDITGCGLDISIDEYVAVEEGYWVDNGVYEVDISPRHCGCINITVANCTENLTANRFFPINGSETTVQTSGGHDKTMTVGISEGICATVKDMDGDPIKTAPVHLTWVDKNWDNAICINKTEGDNTHGNGQNGEYYFTATVNEVGYVIIAAAWPSIMFHSWDLIEVREPYTLYVGGSGPGNYTRIQDAIDNSSNGDTVYVYNGTYYENLVVHKSINLFGEDRDTTTIDGEGGIGCSISADWVNVNEFTIRNGSLGIRLRSNCNNITSNTISNNGDGISLDEYSSGNTIMGNTIPNNGDGISLDWYSRGNTIMGNNISNNENGIYLDYSNNNTITTNNIISNNNDGIYLDCSSNNNNISGNIISSNKWYGLEINGYYGQSNYNIITGNNIISNHMGGICVNFNCYYNTITKNNIQNNKEFGLSLYNSGNTVIEKNNIQNNEGVGLEIVGFSHNNVIEKNNFIGNGKNVIHALSSGNTWDANYWDNWIGVKINLPIFQKFPKVIFGRFPSFINFDWHPAREPYDIGV